MRIYTINGIEPFYQYREALILNICYSNTISYFEFLASAFLAADFFTTVAFTAGFLAVVLAAIAFFATGLAASLVVLVVFATGFFASALTVAVFAGATLGAIFFTTVSLLSAEECFLEFLVSLPQSLPSSHASGI